MRSTRRVKSQLTALFGVTAVIARSITDGASEGWRDQKSSNLPPRRYFGVTWFGVRIDKNTRFATPFRPSSHAMSIAEFPIPTMTTFLPTKSWGVFSST